MFEKPQCWKSCLAEKKQTAKAGKSESWEWNEVNVRTNPRIAQDINQIFYQDDVVIVLISNYMIDDTKLNYAVITQSN